LKRSNINPRTDATRQSGPVDYGEKFIEKWTTK